MHLLAAIEEGLDALDGGDGVGAHDGHLVSVRRWGYGFGYMAMAMAMAMAKAEAMARTRVRGRARDRG